MVKNIIHILCIGIVAIFFTLFWYRDVSWSTIRVPFYDASLCANGKEIIHTDPVCTIEIVATRDFMGTVSVPITTYGRINEDIWEVTLKEKGEEKILSSQIYYTDKIANGRMFPFGFPIMRDSKGKAYTLSITSIKGESGNALGILSNDGNIFYVTDRKNIFSSSNQLIHFFIDKVVNLVQTPSVFFHGIVVWASGLIILWRGRSFKNKKYDVFIIWCLCIIATCIECFWPMEISDSHVLTAFVLLFLVGMTRVIPFERFFLLPAMLVLCIPFAFLFGLQAMPNRIAVVSWTYVLVGLTVYSGSYLWSYFTKIVGVKYKKIREKIKKRFSLV